MWVCSKCQTENGDENEKCVNCNAAYEEPSDEELTNDVDAEENEVKTDNDDEQALILDESDEEADSEKALTQVCPNCGAECSDSVCPFCQTEMPAAESTEAKAPKKSSTPLIIALAALVIVVVLATAGLFVWHFMKPQERVMGEDLLSAKDSISDNKVALTVNGTDVPAKIFEIQLYQIALAYIEDYEAAGNSIKDFKWSDKNEEGKTHREVVLADTYETLVELYAVLSMGEEHATKGSKEDLAALETSIEQMREYYGNDFDTILSLYGYKSVEDYRDYVTLTINAQAITADIENNLERYTKDDPEVYAADSKNDVTVKFESAEKGIIPVVTIKEPTIISAKHILISIDEANGIDAAAAKKTAEEVLKKIKGGEDFDKLMKEYNTDTGEPEEGYIFGKGEMVPEFEDAAFKLKIDEVSEVVKSDYGYHIIKRCLSYADVIDYENMNAKVLINTDLINSMQINLDYEKMSKQLDEIQQRLIERLMAEQVNQSLESGESTDDGATE